MMGEVKSTIVFTHGETTCASAPGKFCRFLYSKRFGMLPWCHLYELDLFEGADGWVKRCKSCLKEHT